MDFDPTLILTVQGATVAAAGITGFIQLAKTLIPPLQTASPTTYQQLAAVLSLVVVGYAAWATGFVFDPISAGGLAIAWYGIARLATATYDAASAVKAAVTEGDH